MPSRMERYYQAETDDNKNTSKRATLNKDLYNKMYDKVEYTNVEGIASIDKTNEIDINKIKEMLRKRDEEREFDSMRQLVKRPTFQQLDNDEKSNQNYDIHELLTKAKEERPSNDLSTDRVYATKYGFLDNPEIREKLRKVQYPIEDDESLKEIINTITNTSMLNKLGDKDLSLNMLDELKSNTEIVTTDNESIRKIIDAQKEKANQEEAVMDKSFYTSGIAFDDQDFDKIRNIEEEDTGNRFVIGALIFILLVVLTAGVILGLIMYFK